MTAASKSHLKLTVNLSFITAHNSGDMILHDRGQSRLVADTRDLQIILDKLTYLVATVAAHPARKLGVPHHGVATNELAI